MINAVELHNFKSFRDQRIELGRFTVFVGPNASGKTSVLQAIDLAARAARPRYVKADIQGSETWFSEVRPSRVFRGPRSCDWLYTRGGKGELRIACETLSGTFAVVASPPAVAPHSFEDFGKRHWEYRVLPAPKEDLKQIVPPSKAMKFLRLNVMALTRPSYSRRSPPKLGQDGSGLASVLAFMALNDPDAFARLVHEMQVLIPQLSRIRFTRSLVRETERQVVRIGDRSIVSPISRAMQGDAILFDFVNAPDIASHLASEGTLLLLGLLTALSGMEGPQILMLDDLEHGLHPLVQRDLLLMLRRIMARFPELQILATAHSPYLLDGLEAEEVRLITSGPDGHSVCGKLNDHPQFARWKDEMAPGELWSLFGEKWLTTSQVKRLG